MKCDPVADAQLLRAGGQAVAFAALADQDQGRAGRPGDGGPGVEQQVEVLLGMEAAGEDDPGAGREAGFDLAPGGPGAEMPGIDPAGHPDHPGGGDAQGEPLGLDVAEIAANAGFRRISRRRTGNPRVLASSSASP